MSEVITQAATPDDRALDRAVKEQDTLRWVRSDAIDKALKLHGQTANADEVVATAQTFFNFLIDTGESK